MLTTPTILALICFLVPPTHQKHNGEKAEEARERYETISEAVREVAGEDERLSLFLLTVARHESTFRRDIHSGKVRGDAGRSWGLFQIMISHEPTMRIKGTPYAAKDIVGTGPKATRRAVEVAAGILAPIVEGCQGEPMCVFKTYGGVGKVVKPEVLARLEERVATYGKLQGERAAQKKRAGKSQPTAIESSASALPTLAQAM